MWLAINDNYEVSDDGQVRHRRFQKPLRGCVSDGYRSVKLGKYGGKEYVHRLVAQRFLPSPTEDLCEVDHIDHDRTNNAAWNLRWVSRSQNNLNRVPRVTPQTNNRLGQHHICEWRGYYVVSGKRDGQKIHKYFKTLKDAVEYRDVVFT